MVEIDSATLSDSPSPAYLAGQYIIYHAPNIFRDLDRSQRYLATGVATYSIDDRDFGQMR